MALRGWSERTRDLLNRSRCRLWGWLGS